MLCFSTPQTKKVVSSFRDSLFGFVFVLTDDIFRSGGYRLAIIISRKGTVIRIETISGTQIFLFGKTFSSGK